MKRRQTKPSRATRPTKADRIAESVAHDYAHMHSATINSRVRVLQFEAEELDKALAALQARVTQAKARREVIEAALAGLGAVLARR